MEKAFDVKELEARLLGKGLVAVEGLANIVADEVVAWIEESAVMAAKEQPLLAIVVPVVEALKPMLKAEIDKIDGKVG